MNCEMIFSLFFYKMNNYFFLSFEILFLVNMTRVPEYLFLKKNNSQSNVPRIYFVRQ